eukprot:gene27497-34222_t
MLLSTALPTSTVQQQVSLAVEVHAVNAASQIQPGLSTQRMTRLLARRPQLYTQSELKTLKLSIIDSLQLNHLPAVFSVALAVTGSVERSNDQEVATQALYKANGAMSLFRIDEGVESSHPVRVLEGLLSLCSASPAAPSAGSAALVVSNLNISRGKLRPEVTIAILRLVCKDLVTHLSKCLKSVLSIAYKNIVSSSSGDGHILITHTTLPVIAVSAKLLEELCTRIDDPTLVLSSVIFVQAVKKVLAAYTFTLSATSNTSSGTSSSSNNTTTPTSTAIAGTTKTEQDLAYSSTELHMAVRSSCYAVVAQVAARNASLITVDIELLVLLFKLLEREDERVLSRIYTALEGIRVAHQNAIDASSSSSSSSATTTTASNPLLRELIARSRSSADTRQRLAAVQWVTALFRPSDPIVVETLVVLA